jgi:uncharacterized protein (TIGR02266 family)
LRTGRVNLEIPLDVQAGDATTAAVTHNISPSGAFLTTPRLLPVGVRVTLRLAVPNFAVRFVLDAEVRWLRSEVWGDDAAEPAGMGVRFIDPPIVVSICLDEVLRAASGRLP